MGKSRLVGQIRFYESSSVGAYLCHWLALVLLLPQWQHFVAVWRLQSCKCFLSSIDVVALTPGAAGAVLGWREVAALMSLAVVS